MNLTDFIATFPDEQSCRAKFREIREKEGIICRKCSHKEHYWKRDKECWECKKCHDRTFLRVGTIMESSKLPFRDWFIAMHLMTATKKSISALEMQRQLGRKRYDPVWRMMHLIRKAMGQRDDRYKVEGTVELDDAFFTVTFPKDENKVNKAGRGTDKANVMVMISYDDNIPKDQQHKGKRPKSKPGFLKMKIMDGFGAPRVKKKVEEHVSPEATIKSDGSTSYNTIKDVVKAHQSQTVESKKAGEVLPWVHIAISNAKRLLLDTFHSVSKDLAQNYLDEFCWKFNRRNFNSALFDRVLLASVSAGKTGFR